ncbi:MAG: SDR family NAD(P)-dependent oxidoreductase [bacterium]
MQNNKTKNVIIIGSSKGLGAELVNEFLKYKNIRVFGIARTEYKEIQNNRQNTEKYKHIKLDISSEECSSKIASICSELIGEPIYVIFNAACVKSDVKKDNFIDFDIWREIDSVGINGLRNVLEGVQSHLLEYGGVFMGISSYSALNPLIFFPTIAYPASKSYLNMVLRALRFIWKKNKKIRIISVNLGYMRKKQGNSILELMIPTFSNVAKVLSRAIVDPKAPNTINYTPLYNFIYGYCFKFFPDSLYYWIFHVFLKKIINSIKDN